MSDHSAVYKDIKFGLKMLYIPLSLSMHLNHNQSYQTNHVSKYKIKKSFLCQNKPTTYTKPL